MKEPYALGLEPPNFPVPAIQYRIDYQIGDGDYWCGVYNHTNELAIAAWAMQSDDDDYMPDDIDRLEDELFTMLWSKYTHEF